MKKTVIALLLILAVLSVLPATVKAKDGTDRPSVALVLSGGGAKGVAHIPIIEELERYGIPIDKVFGTSMGALVGGLYSAGYSPKEMTEIVTGQDLMSMFTTILSSGYNEVLNAFDYSSNNIISLSLSQGIGGTTGLIDDYMIMNFLVKYIGNVPSDIDFDTDLVVPYECNATDMITGDEVIFRSGSLLTAMRSSMSIPIAFEPVITEDKQVYMDGGVVSNYIVHRAIEEGFDIIICVTLNGYDNIPADFDDYTSLSGTALGTLNVVLSNASKGELDQVDYWFSPDETMFTTLGFSDIEGILGQSYLEVEQQQDKFAAIAENFTEGQKEYKDPDRESEYHSRFQEQQKKTYRASREALHEDMMGRTRVSIGLYGSGGYGYTFREPDEFEENSRSYHTLFPTLSLRTFIKDLGGSRISLDNRIRISINQTSDLSALVLLRLTGDSGERLFTTFRTNLSAGTLSSLTDKTVPDAYLLRNDVENLISTDLGFMLTDERSHSIQLYGRTEWIWAAPFMEYGTAKKAFFLPSVHLEAVFYPDYRNGFFGQKGGRYDFLGYIGWNAEKEEIEYKIAFASKQKLKLSEKTSLGLDFTAVSARASLDMRSTFEPYGGWSGVPGYVPGIRYTDFITGGMNLQIELGSGFVNRFLSIGIRGGVRSERAYKYIAVKPFESLIPFAYCFEHWDLGINAGLGLGTPVGDIIIGVGFNKDLQLALYFELT